MKDNTTKLRFIELRAEGKSYGRISEELSISKSTCSEWERELSREIQTRKAEALEELYDSYGINKEARVKRITATLDKIDAAIEEADLSTVPPDKLLKMKLEYEKALREERDDQFTGYELGTGSEANLLIVASQIFRKQASGEISATTAAGLFQSLGKLGSAVASYENQDLFQFGTVNETEL